MSISKKLNHYCRLDEDPEYRAEQFTRMRNNDEQTTIGAILEMTPGTKDDPQWVNGEFTAEVNEAKTRQTKAGASFVTGSLVDPDTGASIAFSAFGRKMFPPAGSLVTIGGQGISLGEYNQEPQLTLGQKATVNKVGGNAAPARGHAAPATRPPPGQNAGNAAARPASAILGVTVGMAVNNACHLALEEAKDPTASGLVHGSADYWRRVWEHASSILRIAAHLEKGKLAPNPAKEGDDNNTGADLSEEEAEQARIDAEAEAEALRQARNRPKENARPAATQSGAAFDHSNKDEEDVPF